MVHGLLFGEVDSVGAGTRHRRIMDRGRDTKACVSAARHRHVEAHLVARAWVGVTAADSGVRHDACTVACEELHRTAFSDFVIKSAFSIIIMI